MDSVCEESGPREPSQAFHPDVKCTDIADIQKEIVECPASTEVQKEVADAAPTSSETPRQDAASPSDGRRTPSAPKAGKSSYFVPFQITSWVFTINFGGHTTPECSLMINFMVSENIVLKHKLVTDSQYY